MPSQEDAGALQAAQQLIKAEAAALMGLQSQLDTRLMTAAQLILQRPGKVLTAGVGTSGHVAQRLAHLLSVTGTPAVFVHPADGLHGGLGVVQPGDVLFSVSKGGQSEELNEFTRRAKKLGAKIIVLTMDPNSELSQLADLAVGLSIPAEADPGGIVAMGSTLVTSAWGDALSIILMQMRGYGWDSVLFTHPNGAVGARAPHGCSAMEGGCI